MEEIVDSTKYGLSVKGSNKGKFPILRMNNLIGGQVDTSELQYVDLEDDQFERFRLSKDDILFNRTNSFELVGKTSMFISDGDYVFASYLIRISVDKEKVLPRFLNYYLNLPGTQKRLKMLATRGVGQSNISAAKLKGLLVPVPPLVEQERIVQTLRALDEKIESEAKTKRALEEILRTLIRQILNGQIRIQDMEVR